MRTKHDDTGTVTMTHDTLGAGRVCGWLEHHIRLDTYPVLPVLPVSWLAVNWRHIWRQDERDHGGRD